MTVYGASIRGTVFQDAAKYLNRLGWSRRKALSPKSGGGLLDECAIREKMAAVLANSAFWGASSMVDHVARLAVTFLISHLIEKRIVDRAEVKALFVAHADSIADSAKSVPEGRTREDRSVRKQNQKLLPRGGRPIPARVERHRWRQGRLDIWPAPREHGSHMDD